MGENDFVIPILREDYYLVIPAIPGFDPDAPEADFTSVEQVADEVAAWLSRCTRRSSARG